MLSKRNALFAVGTIGVSAFVAYATNTQAQPPFKSGTQASKPTVDDHAGHDHAGHDHAGHDHGNQTQANPPSSSPAVIDAPSGGPPPLPGSGSAGQFPSEETRQDSREPLPLRARPLPNPNQSSQSRGWDVGGNCPLGNGTCSFGERFDGHHHSTGRSELGHLCPLLGNQLSRTPYRDSGAYLNDRPRLLSHSGHNHAHHDAPSYDRYRQSHDCPLEVYDPQFHYHGH